MMLSSFLEGLQIYAKSLSGGVVPVRLERSQSNLDSDNIQEDWFNQLRNGRIDSIILSGKFLVEGFMVGMFINMDGDQAGKLKVWTLQTVDIQ